MSISWPRICSQQNGLSEPILTDQHSDHSSRLGGEKLGEFLSSPKFQGENETIT